jgi:CheY-like chemotaxis protein
VCVSLPLLSGLTVVGGTNWAQRRRRIKKMPPLISAPSSAASQDLLANEQDEASDIATEIAPKVEPLRILIIEDSITIILIVTKLLEKKGHIVESEKNGFAGLNRLKEVFNTKNDFDLVLLDVQMPVLDGFECVSRYRAFEMEQIKNLNNVALNKSKTDTLKLLLHSKYFRINYANNLQHNSFNVDNFKYTGSSNSASQSERPGNVSYEGCTSSNNDFSNFPSRMDSVDAADTDDVSKDEASIASNSYSHKSDIVLRRGNMAIVGMSANNDNESRILALRKGMNFFITKPFSNSDLQNILNLFDS